LGDAYGADRKICQAAHAADAAAEVVKPGAEAELGQNLQIIFGLATGLTGELSGDRPDSRRGDP
jgi:hypothetical protein